MHKCRGFTLIELMVVVAILALLVSITMPAFSEARRVSKKTACQSNLHQIGAGVHAYVQVNRDMLPYVAPFPSREMKIARALNRKPFAPLPLVLANEMAGGNKPADLEQFMLEMEQSGKRGTHDAFLCAADRVGPGMGDTQAPVVVMEGDRYYDTQTTSYEWWEYLNGAKLQFKTVRLFQDLVAGKFKDVPMVYDREPFHGGETKRGSQNVLYADFHVESDNVH